MVWLGVGLFLRCDYLWRQEKHIKGKVYIFRVGEYHVILLVDVMLYPLFFGNRLGDVVSYPLIFLIIIVLICQVLRCFVTGQIPCTPCFSVGHCDRI